MSNNNFKNIELSIQDPDENKFIVECIETFKNEVLKKPLIILIWGPVKPSDSSDEYKVNLYNKKVAVKEYLKNLKHDVFFSEEIGEEAEKKLGYRPNPKIFEKIQIDRADLVIMLRVSPGTIGEFHDFCNNPDYARKMYVFFDSKHKKGYTHLGTDEIFVTDGGKLEEFSYPKDITECNLQGKISNYIRKVQEALYISPYKKY